VILGSTRAGYRVRHISPAEFDHRWGALRDRRTAQLDEDLPWRSR